MSGCTLHLPHLLCLCSRLRLASTTVDICTDCVGYTRQTLVILTVGDTWRTLALLGTHGGHMLH